MTNKIALRQIDGIFLRKENILTDVSIPFGQNYVVLSVAGLETPSETLSLDDVTSGVVAASLPGSVGSHSLLQISGTNSLTPRNLLKLRDGSSFNPILSGGREIYGLLQCGSLVLNGDSFDDATKRVQISFVREHATSGAFEACPVGDIQNKSVNYQYQVRHLLKDLEDDDFLETKFQEPFQGGSGTVGETSMARTFLLMGA